MPGPNRKPMQKPQNVGATLKRIFQYMAASKGLLIGVFLAILCSALAQIIGTSFLQKVIDNYLEPMLKAWNRRSSAVTATPTG